MGKKEVQGWGSKVIDNLSKDITTAFPGIKGFSSRNLDYMTKFALTYRNYYDIQGELSKVSWSHNIILMSKLQNDDERNWYMNQSIENGWSRSVLNHQIEYKLYDRATAEEKTHNFPKALPPVQSELAIQTLKDPYIFDFLTLAKDYKEKDLEDQLVKHITQFLLELGAGFAFVGRQYHLEIGGDDYYIDLLFYHLDLRCFVVVELKNTEFKPEYVGQLGFYVTAVDETLKKETDNETIGLLLCEDKDKLTVEWSLKSVNAPIGVASYKVKNIIPKEIMEKLPTEEELNLYIKKLPNEEIEEDND